MSDYKHTLNLPQTTFPMKAALAKREPEVLSYWQQIDLYNQLRQYGQSRPKFILHDGPPYANGSIHLGTAMNKILKDIIIKSKTFNGFDAPYIPGWDCHGLPIEHKVEKKVGKVGTKISANEFRNACREFAATQVDLQRQDFKRLGVLADWENPYLTMDFNYEANAIRALAKIIENKHVIRGYKPVHWCTACGSALAEAEVEYKDKQSPAIDVHFFAVDSAAVSHVFNLKKSVATPTSFPIWTTTPWTLPANQAVAVNPELDYALVAVKLNQKSLHLILAKELVDDALARYEADDHEILAIVKGNALEHLKLQHPFLTRQVPIVLGHHVTIEAGTGNVHTAPAHGIDDYIIGQQYQLPHDNPVDARSCFREDVPFVAGLHVFKANDPIIELLREKKQLLHFENIEHSYPHCWRHKTALIFRATPQWFISMEKNHLRQDTLKAIAHTQWIPNWGQTRIQRMVEGRPDWCISRQRTWGIPIAIFVNKKTAELHPNTAKLIEQVAKKVEKAGVDAWYELDIKELLGDDAANYEKVTDILDVWFDSGVTHTCVLEKNPELHVPADLYLEGSDQHRGWFQTSLLTSIAIRKLAPFKTVLTHGYVVDAKGHKMSKSLGNTILPTDVIKKSGADILRLWAAAVDHTNEVSMSDEILKRIADAYRRIRNTARFLLSNLYDFNPKDQLPTDQLLELDRWAIDTANNLQKKIIEAYENYHFQTIYQRIHNFCTVEMGSFYLDIIKDRQYTCAEKSLARRSGQTAMWHILAALVRWLAPILSFTAEEIWQAMPGEKSASVFLNLWYDQFPTITGTDKLQKEWTWLMQVRDLVNRELEQHRAAGKIGSALGAKVTLCADETNIERLIRLGDELRFVLITSEVEVLPLKANDLISDPQLPGIKVNIAGCEYNKCARCWQRRKDVGTIKNYESLCGRCVTNITTATGEQRKFA